MLKLFKKIYRCFDLVLAAALVSISLILLVLRRVLGKTKIPDLKNKILFLTPDGMEAIHHCNPPGHFESFFNRPCASITYAFFIGNEHDAIVKASSNVIGINVFMPFESIKRFFPFTIGVVQEIIAFFVTFRMIKRSSPKAIELMFPSKIAVRAIFLKWLLPIKMITQVRGNLDLIYCFSRCPTFWPKLPGTIFEVFSLMGDKLVSILFYRSCDLVMGYNINNMLSAISNGARPEKTKLSRIKIDRSMLDILRLPREAIDDLPTNGKIISVWSRLAQEKCVLQVIQAVEKVLDDASEEVHLVIIGDGPEKVNIISYLNTSRHKDYIHILGYRNRNYIAQVAFYSFLAIVPYGGSSLLEAVLLEVPVVAFDIEWHSELIRDSETGYLADFPDIDSLKDKITEVLLDPNEAKRRAVAAKALASKMFDSEEIDKKEKRYYDSIFEDK